MDNKQFAELVKLHQDSVQWMGILCEATVDASHTLMEDETPREVRQAQALIASTQELNEILKKVDALLVSASSKPDAPDFIINTGSQYEYRVMQNAISFHDPAGGFESGFKYTISEKQQAYKHFSKLSANLNDSAKAYIEKVYHSGKEYLRASSGYQLGLVLVEIKDGADVATMPLKAFLYMPTDKGADFEREVLKIHGLPVE